MAGLLRLSRWSTRSTRRGRQRLGEKGRVCRTRIRNVSKIIFLKKFHAVGVAAIPEYIDSHVPAGMDEACTNFIGFEPSTIVFDTSYSASNPRLSVSFFVDPTFAVGGP